MCQAPEGAVELACMPHAALLRSTIHARRAEELQPSKDTVSSAEKYTAGVFPKVVRRADLTGSYLLSVGGSARTPERRAATSRGRTLTTSWYRCWSMKSVTPDQTASSCTNHVETSYVKPGTLRMSLLGVFACQDYTPGHQILCSLVRTRMKTLSRSLAFILSVQ